MPRADRDDPFRPFVGWNDVDEIKESIETALAAGAGVTIEELRAARSRLIFDGWHGPFSDEEYEAVVGRAMPLERAMLIVRAAHDAELPEVGLDDPDSGWLCDGDQACRHDDHEHNGFEPMFHSERVALDRTVQLR